MGDCSRTYTPTFAAMDHLQWNDINPNILFLLIFLRVLRVLRGERFELESAVADDDTDLGGAAVAHFAHHQVHPADADEVTHHRPAVELPVDVLGERQQL